MKLSQRLVKLFQFTYDEQKILGFIGENGNLVMKRTLSVDKLFNPTNSAHFIPSTYIFYKLPSKYHNRIQKEVKSLFKKKLINLKQTITINSINKLHLIHLSNYYPSMSKQPPILFKILLIGSSGVGKSSLLMKYIKNTFSYDYQVTTGVEYFTKTVQINDKTNIKLQIWDTVGQQAYKSVVRSFYKGVTAILLVYSIDKQQTYDQLNVWMKQIRQHSHQQALIFLIGTKLDLEPIRKVSSEQGKIYMNKVNAQSFIQVSSKTGQNIKELFDKVSKGLYKKYQTSLGFRQLVQPMSVPEFGKTQSFNLKNNFTGGKAERTLKKDKNCC